MGIFRRNASSWIQADFDPIFVVGAERSGTTLLSTLLGRHSTIAATPETHFFYDDLMRQALTLRDASHAHLVDLFFRSQRAPDLKLEPERVLGRFVRHPPTYAHLFQAMGEEFAARRGKARIVEKSPHHLFQIPTILTWYPNGRIVHLVRDGRDAVLSLRRAPWTHDDLMLHSLEWRKAAKFGIALERRWQERMLRVRFEELIGDPARVLTFIDEFLGVPFESGQLDTSLETGAVPDWEQEWKGKAGQAPDPSRAGVWRGEASSEELWLMNSVMGKYLKALGYEETAMKECPARRRCAFALRRSAQVMGRHPAVYPFARFAATLFRKRG